MTVTSPAFDRCVLLAIVLNCVSLAMVDPLEGNENCTRNRIVRESEPVFTALFTIEMLFKVRTAAHTFNRVCTLMAVRVVRVVSS